MAAEVFAARGFPAHAHPELLLACLGVSAQRPDLLEHLAERQRDPEEDRRVQIVSRPKLEKVRQVVPEISLVVVEELVVAARGSFEVECFPYRTNRYFYIGIEYKIPLGIKKYNQNLMGLEHYENDTSNWYLWLYRVALRKRIA